MNAPNQTTPNSARRVHFNRGWLAMIAALAMLASMFALASPAEAKVPRSFYGVAPELSPTKLASDDYQRMKRGKVGAVRLLISWSNVQSDLGAGYNWSQVDEIIDNLARRNIEPRPFLYGSLHENRQKPPLGGTMATGWKRFVSAAVERYGRKGSFWRTPGRPKRPVKVWQIWNEQNSSKFFEPKPNVRKYAKLLKISSGPIRKADRRAKIVLGGMFGTPGSPNAISAWKFLDKLYKVKGIKGKFDAVAANPYSPDLRGVKFQIRKLRQVMKRRGDRRSKLYVTEIGWGSDSPQKNSLTKGRKGQAQLLEKSYGLLKRKRSKWKIGGVFWYTWRDSSIEDPCSWCPSAGLLEDDGDPKPAWKRFVKFTGGRP